MNPVYDESMHRAHQDLAERVHDALAKSACNDPVDHPAHYTAGKFETIDVLEDAAAHAPCPVAGALQWQVLKYMLRMWLKGNPAQDAKKARVYLNRLIERLETD